jgi:hypothetical protein
MRRFFIALASFFLLACGNRSAQAFTLPQTMPGAWQLQQTTQAGAKTIGIYNGPGSVTVEVENVGSFAAGLDRTQRMRPEANLVFFNQGEYFVTIRWQQADRAALYQLIRKLQEIVK